MLEAPVVIPAATVLRNSQFDIAPPSLSNRGRTDKASDHHGVPISIDHILLSQRAT